MAPVDPGVTLREPISDDRQPHRIQMLLGRPPDELPLQVLRPKLQELVALHPSHVYSRFERDSASQVPNKTLADRHLPRIGGRDEVRFSTLRLRQSQQTSILGCMEEAVAEGLCRRPSPNQAIATLGAPSRWKASRPTIGPLMIWSCQLTSTIGEAYSASGGRNGHQGVGGTGEDTASTHSNPSPPPRSSGRTPPP